ncbi:MAG: DNA-directed RNA polymerase subunit omega [Omnitrophica WOR_2 bacterium GWF2_63_9]|nr:MAG: DNA-directed RNA polymerase subunit omega [Omnitrophica WOR_2 bacterium GWF2_63_9]
MYKLVVIASKRAKGLAEGAPKFVEIDAKKVTSIALEEIRQGKIFYRDDEEPPAKAKGKKRTAKAGK